MRDVTLVEHKWDLPRNNK